MKDKILNYIEQNCERAEYERNTILQMSEVLKISRNQCSLLLNQMVEKKLLVRVEENPYLFVSVNFLKKQNLNIQNVVVSSLEELFSIKQEKQDFEKLVGYNHSLKETVKQCKATISYPPKGLPMLLYGPTGTGKSFIAKLTYEWAKNQKVLKKEGKFVTVNCSEYANNPELLTANLFGHTKGAFTGADKENEGLISLANHGVLFLDEVHELKAECQEKLFLFMDQGIYHRVGDNEKWYRSDVRIIFATTEDPEKVLLKTLLRRIPMTITIPSLKERGTQERIELLYTLFTQEEERLHCKIKMSSKVYNALLSSNMSGNIGELKSVVQSCCINSLFDREDQYLVIRLDNLPKKMLDEVYANHKSIQNKEHYIDVDHLKGFYKREKAIIQLNEEILASYYAYKNEHQNIEKLMDDGKRIIETYFDQFVHRKKETPQIEYYKRGVMHIFSMIESRYGFKITNNDTIAIAAYLEEIHQEYHDFYSWSLKYEEDCEDLKQLLEDEYFRAANVSLEICSYIKSHLEVEMHPIVIIAFIFYVFNSQKDKRYAQKACVVLAHGFSTASSIADAANRFLQEYIFDAIDMPLHVDTQMMIEKLNLYLDRIGKIKELYLLVDMGSLEEIYKGMHLENANIGIINNVSTPMALEIGNGIRQNMPMEELLQKTILNVNSSLVYHIEQNQKKPPIILCSCASGLGTARKLKSIIEDSLPSNINIEVQTYNYNELVIQKENNPLFEQYNVLCVIGTLDPSIEGIRFIGIEDLIIEDSFEEFDSYFEEYMTQEEMMEFNRNIIHNFSLSNIMSNLTILNPNKLLEQVTNAIERLQQYLNTQFSSRTCFGLYVHICCMIERLVVARGNDEYLECLDFQKEHQDFIDYVQKALKQVEAFYGVSIPIEELKYIYNYVIND